MKYSSKGLRRRGDTDKWEVTLVHKDPLTGESVRSYHTVTARTEKQAERKKNDLIRLLDSQGLAAGTRMTIAELADSFIEYKANSGTVERSTIEDYKKHVKTIKRELGNIRVGDLRIPDVNAWMASMTERGYAPRSVHRPFVFLKQIMKYAMAIDLITKNPCDFCKPPKIQRKQVNALPREERTRMMRLARESEPAPLGLAIELALTTGMRRGEICGLRWSDLGDHEITVNRALAFSGGTLYVKEPKTAESRRTIPLTPRLFAVLSAMRKDAAYATAELGLKTNDSYILGTQEGKDSRPYHPTRLSKDFKSFCDMNAFECTFHDLRHTFATIMIAGGTDVRTVASYLGHANVAVTLNTYAEVDSEAKRAAVSKVSEAFDIDDTFFDERYPYGAPRQQGINLNFTVDQLEAMLAQAKRSQGIAV
ncbi:MAG: site-specific integrase [Eggerthellaceae bacterium]|nr:site-specific integrase [Eggerthellaceae bacterium]